MDDDEDPYESLPGGRNTLVYMSAGAAAGILEHCVMYPIDVVRTRMQSIRPQLGRQTFWDSVTHLIRNERFKTFRGMSAVIAGAGPAHALYFSCYENIKELLLNRQIIDIYPKNNFHNHQRLGSETSQLQQNNKEIFTNTSYTQTTTFSHRALAQSIAGCGATVVHDAVMNPVEVVKQRMQMYKSPFKTSLTCARHILKHEGLKAFYRSYFTQLTMNLPYHSLHFVTYEYMQDLTNRQRDYNPKAHVISGAIAGALASAVTTPLDVCKTLLNTQEKLALVAANSDRISGLLDASRVVYKCCGFRGYFHGIQARVLVAMPSTAISWSVYEFFKSSYK
uniref:Mitoferrin-1 n=1 Tax=Aceria tosichella TaxID=561515 RepID=A0A6G1SEU3_9ACAR